MSLRVAGADPGTSSLDLLILEDGAVGDQVRFSPAELQADPSAPATWLRDRGPLALIAGPSGYGLPLVRAADCIDRDLALMTLRRPDDPGGKQRVVGFANVVRTLRDSGLPVVFLPGVIHLPSVPAYRKHNRVDLGTADKLCVAALALHNMQSGRSLADCHCCVIELGSAFTACLVVQQGRIVDGVGGTGGPLGWQSGGAWDGETAYLLSPLRKSDLFTGGAASVSDPIGGRLLFRESLRKTVAGLQAVTGFREIHLSGRLLELEPKLVEEIVLDLEPYGRIARLASLPGAWVKHAAQGAAVLADGLAGGRHASLVDHLQLRAAAGTVLDWLGYPRANEVRAAWGV